MRREGLERVPVAAARAMVGGGARALIERGFAHNGTPLAQERVAPLVAEFLAHYEDHIADETRLFPGARRRWRAFGDGLSLRRLHQQARAAGAAAADRGLASPSRFAAICGRETFPMHKPDGRTLLLAISAARGDRSAP